MPHMRCPNCGGMPFMQCPFCGAQAQQGAPHGENESCPHQVAILEAQKNLLIAQTEATQKNTRRS